MPSPKARADVPPPKRNCCGCMSRCLCHLIFIGVMVTAAAVAVSILLTGESNPFALMEPSGTPPGLAAAFRWDAMAGLSLVVEFAMDEVYRPFFIKAIQNWDVTDSVSLTPTQVETDRECKVSMGRLRMCNDDYGETSWRGLTVTVLDGRDHIVYATAKINDRHMDSDAQRTYTV